MPNSIYKTDIQSSICGFVLLNVCSGTVPPSSPAFAKLINATAKKNTPAAIKNRLFCFMVLIVLIDKAIIHKIFVYENNVYYVC